jgi:aminoglycoside phosphotransferase family enzyme
LITTHISWVFLTDYEVWKLKRPVDYGFVDYTTLERRRQCCEDEVRLNRRLAPDVYLGVVPVRLAPTAVGLVRRRDRRLRRPHAAPRG